MVFRTLMYGNNRYQIGINQRVKCPFRKTNHKKGFILHEAFVGCTRFELATPALSRQCSKPTELTTRIADKNKKEIMV